MLDNIGISLSGMIDIITEYGIEIRKAGNNIEWKFQGETDEFWRLLMDATELNSQIIEMQRGETSLQWRIVGSDEWIDLITYDNLAYIGSQPIRDEFNNQLTIVGRRIQDNLSPPEPIDYMHGEPLLLQDGERIEHNFLPMSPIITKNTFSINSNQLKLWPIKIMNPAAIAGLYINVITAADATLKIFIYNGDELSGKPTTKMFESTTIDCSTIGTKSHNIPFFINEGFYFIGYQKTGDGEPVVRSIADTSYNILSAFNSLSACADDTSASNVTHSCYSYDTALTNLNEEIYDVSSSHRIIFATSHTNSMYEIYEYLVVNTGLGSLREVIWSEYDSCYYILTTGNEIYKGIDLNDLTIVQYNIEQFATSFTSICECSEGIVIVDNNHLWIKYHDETIFNRVFELPKHQLAQDAFIGLHGNINDRYVFASYIFAWLDGTLRTRQINMITLSQHREWASIYGGTNAHSQIRAERCSNGVWVFSGATLSYNCVSVVDLRDDSFSFFQFPTYGYNWGGLAIDKDDDSIYVYYSNQTPRHEYYIASYDYGQTWTDPAMMIYGYNDDIWWGLSMRGKIKVWNYAYPHQTNSVIAWTNNNFDSYTIQQSLPSVSQIVKMCHVGERDDNTFMVALANGYIAIYKYLVNE